MAVLILAELVILTVLQVISTQRAPSPFPNMNDIVKELSCFVGDFYICRLALVDSKFFMLEYGRVEMKISRVCKAKLIEVGAGR